jgi:2-C-methyl-D-erythritol 4-phosphate cytidylyltransferase
MFRYGLLKRALASAPLSQITDEASAIETLGFAPKLVESDGRNLKVTYPQDAALAALLLEQEKTQTSGR